MYGNVTQARIAMGQDGVSLGYGYVDLETSAMASKALADTENLGMYVAEIKSKEERKKEVARVGTLNSRQAVDVRVHIKGFDPRASEEELSRLFSSFGVVKKWSKSQFCSVQAQVTYATRADALKCIGCLHGQEFGGRRYTACFWQPSDARKLEKEEQMDRQQYMQVKQTQLLNQPIQLASATVNDLVSCVTAALSQVSLNSAVFNQQPMYRPRRPPAQRNYGGFQQIPQ